MNISRVLVASLFVITLACGCQGEQVFFSDGTVYDTTMTMDDILSRFDRVENTSSILLFHDKYCLACEEAMATIKEVESEFPEIRIEYYDLFMNTTNKLLFEEYMVQYNQTGLKVPTAFIGPAGLEGADMLKTLFEPFSRLYFQV